MRGTHVLVERLGEGPAKEVAVKRRGRTAATEEGLERSARDGRQIDLGDARAVLDEGTRDGERPGQDDHLLILGVRGDRSRVRVGGHDGEVGRHGDLVEMTELRGRKSRLGGQ